MSEHATRDLPPLTAETLEHMNWLVIEPAAVAVLTKPQLGRLLDDRKQLIEALQYIFEHITDKHRGPRDLYPAFGLDARRAIEMASAALARVRGA